MRPRWLELAVRSRRFLRSRGDAPPATTVRDSHASVPPLTRRCARPARSGAARMAGSSAHAEMRPPSRQSSQHVRRFLRSRGDAPRVYRYALYVLPVPPLTRRCALPRCLRCGAGRGSSAHAEMRPSTIRGTTAHGGFLRSRGDAPHVQNFVVAHAPVPPLTRRCALRGHRRELRAHGSSAHAEMRPSVRVHESDFLGFLRSRGDAPSTRPCGVRGRAVPPLTRRCAAGVRLRERRVVGSSAHAEMRPSSWRRTAPRSGFLRSRGDAPTRPIGPEHAYGVPPLTRRCAQPGGLSHGSHPGSSAHAEMRRARRSWLRLRCRFLRSRGDAPINVYRPVEQCMVPPLTRRCALGVKLMRVEVRGSSAHAEMRPQGLMSRL